MKICNLSHDDYSNFAYEQTKALLKVGLDAECIKEKKHQFNYGKEGEVLSENEIYERLRRADIVQIFHSHRRALTLFQKSGSKAKLTVWHTGTIYREQPTEIYNLFQTAGAIKHFTDQCEFLISNPHLIYIAAAIDIDEYKDYKFNFETQRPFFVSHFPSKSQIKGSETICKMMEDMDCKFTYSDKLVSHDQQLERMSRCDIYIELFQNQLNGKDYGCYGVTAFESAAMRKIVFTQNIYEFAYRNSYHCELPFFICNTPSDFIEKMKMVLKYSPIQLIEHQRRTNEWLVRNHSLEATGMKVRNILLGI